MLKSWVWTSVKLTSVAFNSISTYNVFFDALEKGVHRNVLFLSPQTVVITGVILAVILIDVLFIALVNFLEAPKEEGELYRHRKPYAIGLLMLYVAIVLIGLQDEGLLALAPRVGLGIITLVSWMRYSTLSRWELDQSWEEEFQKRRYRRERKDTLKLSEAQRKIKQKQQLTALSSLQDELLDKYMGDFRRQLKLGWEDDEESVIIYKKDPPLLAAGTAELEDEIRRHFETEPEPIEGNIYRYKDTYYFYSPYTEQVFYLTAQGKPYKNLTGARRAYGKHASKYEQNL